MRTLRSILFFIISITASTAWAAPDIATCPWGVDASAFANLSTAVHSPAASGQTIVVSKPVVVNTLTVPANVAIVIIKGGQITVNSGKVLTINGTLTVGSYQAFAGTGSVLFGANAIENLYSQWFAAGIDLTATVQSVIGNLRAGQTARLTGNFRVTTLTINAKENWHIVVDGKIMSIAADTAAGAGVDDRATSQGLFPVFKIANSNHWSITGSSIDNYHREAFWIDTCTDFVLACDVHGSGLNDNLEGARIRYSSNFAVRDMALDHVTAKPSRGYRTHSNAIVFFDCDHFRILNVRSRYNGMNGLYIGTGCADFMVDGNLIEHNAGSGIQMTWSSFSPTGVPHGDAAAFCPIRWNVSNNVIRFNRADGIDLANTYASPVDVYGVVHGNITAHNGWDNESTTGGTATVDGSGFGTFSNINKFAVTDNHAIEPAQTALFASNCADFVFSGNTAIKSRAGTAGKGAYIGTCSNGRIENNSIKVPRTMDALNTNPTLTDVTVRGNTFDGLISINNGTYTNCKFLNNKFITYNMINALFDFIDNTVTVNAASTNGVNVGANGLNIERNTINATNFGLVSAGVNSVRIVGNNVIGTVGGIRVDSNVGSQIIGNYGKGGTSPGIHLLGTSDNCTLSANRGESTSGNSLRVESSCTLTHRYANKAISGPDSYSGTYGITY